MTANPLLGDRAAWDATNYPSRHSSDLSTSTPIYHVPAGTSVGDVPSWDGSKWVAGSLSASGAIPPIMTLSTFEGDLSVGASPFEIYNLYEVPRAIIRVFLSVSTAPTGDDIIVDVKVDGTSIFTTPNRPKVLAGEVIGSSVTFDNPAWAELSYLTVQIAQVGSSTPGKDLTVHVVHEQGVYGSGSGS